MVHLSIVQWELKSHPSLAATAAKQTYRNEQRWHGDIGFAGYPLSHSGRERHAGLWSSVGSRLGRE